MRDEDVLRIDTFALLQKLLAAESEQEVVAALDALGLWADEDSWRYYGDTPGNWASAGNQQSSPEAALIEKLTNSIDARLMLECLLAGTDPRSETAPKTIREAVAVYFEGADPEHVLDHQGNLADWGEDRLREVARGVTFALTGATAREGAPFSVSIADAGEGQAPEDLPGTILSIDQQLKQRIPFVQGKWNMGGMGALRFAGSLYLQLVLSRRNPVLAKKEGKSSDWGLTVVRREDPNAQRRVSALRYLAPVGSEGTPNRGEVLRIEPRPLPIFPVGQNPYSQEADWGTLLKLYEYRTRFATHMFRRSGLLERLDLLLPNPALPVRLHECRAYRGAARSFETTLTGVITRLADSTNIEDQFPDSGQLTVEGERIPFTIYAFKASAADTYRRNEGVLFVVNGQTHATIPDSFFRRADVGMGLLRRSLLVVLDCSHISDRAVERLFMNSRDRLSEDPLTKRVQSELADVLHSHEGLRLLRERRRQEEAEAKLTDAKPLEQVLEDLIKRQSSLSALFAAGTHASNPFTSKEVSVQPKFEGKRHPTEFRFKGHEYGFELRRSSHLGERTRITFETDAEDGYFSRRIDPGVLSVSAERGGHPVAIDNTVHLRSGFAHLTLTLPEDAAAGDVISVTVAVSDPTLIDPFVNSARLNVLQAQKPRAGGERKTKERPKEAPEGAKERRPAGIDLPEMTDVHRDEWAKFEMDAESGVRAEVVAKEDGKNIYGFFINMDNRFLQAELKATREQPSLVQARYRFALVLAGLGAIRWAQIPLPDDAGREERSVEDAVRIVTDALAPIILPTLATLGTLAADDIEQDDSVGEFEDD